MTYQKEIKNKLINKINSFRQISLHEQTDFFIVCVSLAKKLALKFEI